MSIATRIADYLAQHQVNYETLKHESAASLIQAAKSLKLSEQTVLRALVLKAGEQLACAVLPLTYMVDFKALEQATGKQYEPVAVLSVADIFQDCEAGVVPALARLYGIETFYDRQLLNMQSIVFEAGASDALLRINTEDFLALIDGDQLMSFARPQDELRYQNSQQALVLSQFTPDHELHQRLNELYTLPPVPVLLQELQTYTQSNSSDKSALLAMLTNQHELAVQLQGLAVTAFLSPDHVAGKVLSTSEAIDSLGIELSVALLKGLLVWQTIPLPMDGPLGKAALLTHACLSAQLSYSLMTCSGGIRDVEPALACQTALLHNAGYLLLSHLFKPEYFLFNRMVQANPDIPVVEIEKQMLAYGQASEIIKKGHAESGLWLMQHWNFEEVLQTVCHQHHNTDYSGPHQEYVHLLILVNYLLGIHGLGEKCSSDFPEKSIKILKLDDQCVNDVKKSILKKGFNEIEL